MFQDLGRRVGGSGLGVVQDVPRPAVRMKLILDRCRCMLRGHLGEVRRF